MPRDAQPIAESQVILDDLLALGAAALSPIEGVLDIARLRVAALVTVDGQISGPAIEENQTAAHGLAWLATYVESLRQMQAWAARLSEQGKFGEVEQLIHQIAFGEYLSQITGGIQMNQAEILRPQDMGLSPEDMRGLLSTPPVMILTQSGNTQAARLRLVALMQERRADRSARVFHGRVTRAIALRRNPRKPLRSDPRTASVSAARAASPDRQI